MRLNHRSEVGFRFFLRVPSGGGPVLRALLFDTHTHTIPTRFLPLCFTTKEPRCFCPFPSSARSPCKMPGPGQTPSWCPGFQLRCRPGSWQERPRWVSGKSHGVLRLQTCARSFVPDVLNISQTDSEAMQLARVACKRLRQADVPLHGCGGLARFCFRGLGSFHWASEELTVQSEARKAIFQAECLSLSSCCVCVCLCVLLCMFPKLEEADEGSCRRAHLW